MIKFKTVCQGYEKNSDGMFNVKIQMTHNQAVSYIQTDYYVFAQHFDKKDWVILSSGTALLTMQARLL